MDLNMSHYVLLAALGLTVIFIIILIRAFYLQETGRTDLKVSPDTPLVLIGLAAVVCYLISFILAFTGM